MLLTVYVKCGTMIPKMATIIPELTSTIVDLLKIGVPVLLIIFGMLDLGKAVIAQKEDEIKKSQGLFVKRLISAAIVFLVFVVVELVFNLVGGAQKTDIWNCVNCFVNGAAAEDDVEVSTDCVTGKSESEG